MLCIAINLWSFYLTIFEIRRENLETLESRISIHSTPIN